MSVGPLKEPPPQKPNSLGAFSNPKAPPALCAPPSSPGSGSSGEISCARAAAPAVSASRSATKTPAGLTLL